MLEKLRLCIFLRFLEEFHVEFGYEFSVHSDTPPFLAVIHRVWLLFDHLLIRWGTVL